MDTPDSSGLSSAVHPLLQPAWVDYTQQRWRVEPLHVTYQIPDRPGPRLAGVLYLNSGGRVCQPPLVPEITVQLLPPGAIPREAARDWLALAPLLAAELTRRGIQSGITLPAIIADARPLTWAGLRCSIQYTAIAALPHDLGLADSGVRRNARRAAKAGYRVVHPAPWADTLLCLQESAQRGGFSLPIDLPALEQLGGMLGPDRLRSYVCYNQRGEPAASRVVLHSPGHTAIDWLTGTATTELASGATQLLVQQILVDVSGAGATAFDFEGANIPGVAESKLRWGAVLTPIIAVEQLNGRNLVRDAWRFVRSARRGSRH